MAAAAPSVNNLNPIPKLVDQYLRDGKLSVVSPDYLTAYHLYPKDGNPWIHVAWWRADFPSSRHTRFGDDVCGWVNGGAWNTCERRPDANCGCSECMDRYGKMEERVKEEVGIISVTAVLGVILSGIQFWKFQCGMGISNMHDLPQHLMDPRSTIY